MTASGTRAGAAPSRTILITPGHQLPPAGGDQNEYIGRKKQRRPHYLAALHGAPLPQARRVGFKASLPEKMQRQRFTLRHELRGCPIRHGRATLAIFRFLAPR